MNPKLEFIFSRRSVRNYKGQDVPDGLITDLLEAAMAAPSAVCKDPWHFIVVREKPRLKRISEGLPNGKMLADASAGIVVCGERGKAHDGMLSYLLQDCSAAIENILLAATALDLGACWLGVHPREDRIAYLRRLLRIPDMVTPIAVVAVGLPDEPSIARTRYTDTAVHTEEW